MLAEGLLHFQGLELQLDILEIDGVLPHEATITAVVRRLAARLFKDRVQADPILVDRESHAVLDGMHRLAALKRVGAQRVLVCLLDYYDDSIMVFRWLRFLPFASDLLMASLRTQLQLSPVASQDYAISQVDRFNSPLALLSPSETLLSRKPFVSLIHSYAEVRRFDRILSQVGASFRSLSEEEGWTALRSGRGCVLYPPSISKRDVVACSVRRNLLPPKSTRHVVPIRPVDVRFPLEPLSDQRIGLPEARSRLKEILKKLPRYISNPGTRYRGRVYQDRLLIFGGRT